MRFTPTTLKSLKPKDKPYIVREGDGFSVMVYPPSTKNPRGAKVWYYIHKINGRDKKIRIGEYPAITIAEARGKAAGYATAKKRGELQDVVRKSSMPTVKEFAAIWIRDYCKANNVARVVAERERNLNKDVYPVIGALPVDQVTRADVHTVISKIIKRGAPVSSNNVLTIIKSMLSYAVKSGLIDANPALGYSKQPEGIGSRTLTKEEIKVVWHGLAQGKVTRNTINCLRLILLTGQRPGECLNMFYDEIQGDWWEIPAHKTKSKTFDQRVYLTPLAKELIGSGETGPVFPTPLEVDTLRTAIARLIESKRLKVDHFSPHDLRRTCATMLGELGYDEAAVDRRVLNHVPGKVTRTYNKHKYDRAKKEMFVAWYEELSEIINPAEA